MSIKTKTIAAIATAAAIASTNVVHAEENVENATTAAAPTVETAETAKAVEKVEAKVTQNDVDQAKAKSDEANNSYDTAKQSADQAQSQVDEATKTSEAAKSQLDRAQEVADKASDAEVKKAEETAAKDSASVETAKSNVETSAKAKTDADKAVTDQKAKVEQSSKDVEAKQSAAEDAAKDVKNAEDALNGTGLTEALETQKQAKSSVETTKAALEQANTNLTKAEKDAAEAESKIAEAKSKVDAAKTEANAKESKLSSAQSEADRAKSKYDEANEKFKLAESAVNDAPKVNLGEDFANALKEYVELDKEFNKAVQSGGSYSDYKDRFEAARAKLLKYNTKVPGLNKFTPTAADKADTTKYDVNNLPEDVRKELSLFATDILNQMRRQIGTREVKASTSSIGFANEVAKEYEKGQFTWDQMIALNEAGGAGHYAKGINNVARRHGFATTSASDEAQGWQYYENQTATMGVNGYLSKATVSELKTQIFNSMLAFVRTEGDLGHMLSVLGLNDRDEQVYFGLAVSFPKDAFFVHAITGLTEKVVAKDPSFNKTALANPFDLAKLKETLNSASNALAAVEAEKSDAEAKLEAAKSDAEVAKYNLNRANAELELAQSAKSLVAEARAKVEEAKANYAAATKALKDADKRVAVLTSGVEDKKAALEAVQKVLADAEKDLEDAKSTLAADQAKLVELQTAAETATKNVESATNALKETEAKLADSKKQVEELKNAPKLLAEAKANYDAAEKTLAEAKSKLEKAVAELKEAEAEKEAAKAHYDEVFKTYSEYVRAQEELARQRQLKEDYERLVSEGKKPVAVVDATGKIVKYEAQTVVPATDRHEGTVGSKYTAKSDSKSKEVAETKDAAKAKDRKLPETGTESSALTILGLAMSSVAVLFGLKRKEEN